MRKISFNYICLLIVAILTLTSCRVYKEQAGLVYLKNTDIDSVKKLVAPYKLKIKPDDELQITISSTIPQATSHYNLPAINYIGRKDTEVTTSNSIPTYNVTESGEIVIPNIGRLMVKGLTTEEVADLIISKIKDSVVDPIVKVDIKNFNVVVLGEVRTPGTQTFNGQRCSIFDAIGAAGDITLYGRRDNVLLLRETEDAVQTVHLDLTDKEIFTSPFFYLQQNDVLIVEATEIQKENSTYNTMNSFRLQAVSTIVSVVSVLASLGIALLFK